LYEILIIILFVKIKINLFSYSKSTYYLI